VNKNEIVLPTRDEKKLIHSTSRGSIRVFIKVGKRKRRVWGSQFVLWPFAGVQCRSGYNLKLDETFHWLPSDIAQISVSF